MAKVGGINADRLKSIVERVEALKEEVKAANDEIKEILAEAKEADFNVKAIREVIKLRKMDPEDRHDHETNMVTYLHALGMADQPNLFEEAAAKPAKEASAAKKADIVKDVPELTH